MLRYKHRTAVHSGCKQWPQATAFALIGYNPYSRKPRSRPHQSTEGCAGAFQCRCAPCFTRALLQISLPFKMLYTIRHSNVHPLHSISHPLSPAKAPQVVRIPTRIRSGCNVLPPLCTVWVAQHGRPLF